MALLPSMKVNWHQIDVAVKLRLAYLGEKLTYEERLQRVEELVWMRDELLKLVEEEKDDEQTIYQSTNETTADNAKAQLECPESEGKPGTEARVCWSDEAGSGGCCEGRKCGLEKEGRCGRVL